MQSSWEMLQSSQKGMLLPNLRDHMGWSIQSAIVQQTQTRDLLALVGTHAGQRLHLERHDASEHMYLSQY